MLNKEEIKKYIEEIVKQENLVLYDIEYPSQSFGTLRVFIFSKDKNINVDDCAIVSRKIANLPEYEDILPSNASLEVSSPGINRNLRTKEHFFGAVGERVKIRLRNPLENRKNILGILKDVDGDAIKIFDNDSKKEIVIENNNIDKARIDFDFNSIERK